LLQQQQRLVGKRQSLSGAAPAAEAAMWLALQALVLMLN
jgi:hypothetical protein